MMSIRVELTLAVGFLTRVQLPPVDYSDNAMARGVRWYPAVGLAIGSVLALLFWTLLFVFPQPVAVLITIAAGMLLTGALHEDGLADLADGLGGSPEKDRALEIMRDSRIGSYGVLALGMTLALKVTALASLPTAAAMIALIAGHGLGRFSMSWLMDRLPYARSSGAASFMAGNQNADKKAALAALVVTFLLIALGINLVTAITTFLAFFALLAVIASWLKRRLSGYTGDALGASEQLCEALIPLAFIACL